MTEQSRAQQLVNSWAVRLGITTLPELRIVSSRELNGDDGKADFCDLRATVWRIRLRKGLGIEMERVVVHELLHVRTGLTDACHESWIDDVARALVEPR